MTTNSNNNQEGLNSFVRFMSAHTLNLVTLTGQMIPDQAGSGMSIEIDGKLYVLSDGHVLGLGDWSIETTVWFEREHKTLMFPLLRPTAYYKTILGPPRRLIDFAWCELDTGRIEASMSGDPLLRGLRLPEILGTYRGTVTEAPDPRESYGFAAWNAREFQGPRAGQVRERVEEVLMAFDGEDPQNGLYRFQLARGHQGDAHYRGCSGAPIADRSGKIVALVQGAPDGQDIIYGIPLSRLIHLVDREFDPQADIA